MKQFFDLHLYYADWGTKVFMLRLPKKLVSEVALEPFLVDDEFTRLRKAGDNIIVEVWLNDESGEYYYDYEEDGARLASLAPL